MSLPAKKHPLQVQVPQQQQPQTDPVQEQIVAEIRKYHAWLKSTGQLLRPPMHYKGWPKPKQLMPDPENPEKLIPVPEPPPPTPEEIRKRLEEAMKDPAFRKALKENKGPQV